MRERRPQAASRTPDTDGPQGTRNLLNTRQRGQSYPTEHSQPLPSLSSWATASRSSVIVVCVAAALLVLFHPARTSAAGHVQSEFVRDGPALTCLSSFTRHRAAGRGRPGLGRPLADAVDPR